MGRRPQRPLRRSSGDNPKRQRGPPGLRPQARITSATAATRRLLARRCGGPYGVIGADLFLPEPFCHPTLAAPLPPSYEEGAPGRGRARFFEPVPTTHLFCPSLREVCPRVAMGRVGASILPACVIRRRGRRPRRPAHSKTANFRFIGPVPAPQRGTGGHMGPPLRGIWEVIPFNRHGRLSERGSPGTATLRRK